jgi:hypothetical protein
MRDDTQMQSLLKNDIDIKLGAVTTQRNYEPQILKSLIRACYLYFFREKKLTLNQTQFNYVCLDKN